MADVYLGLGSNLGDREEHVRKAHQLISAIPCTLVVNCSPIYETKPVGLQNQGDFLNLVLQLETTLKPLTLLRHLQQIEVDLGRRPESEREKWGPREIDIDILFYGDQIFDSPMLTIPHPAMHERLFVLKPLSDIAPMLEHPVLGHTVTELLLSHDKEASHRSEQ